MKRYTVKDNKYSYSFAYAKHAVAHFIGLSNVFNCELIDNETGELMASSQCFNGVIIHTSNSKTVEMVKEAHKAYFAGMSPASKPFCAHFPKQTQALHIEADLSHEKFESEELKVVNEALDDEFKAFQERKEYMFESAFPSIRVERMKSKRGYTSSDNGIVRLNGKMLSILEQFAKNKDVTLQHAFDGLLQFIESNHELKINEMIHAGVKHLDYILKGIYDE